MPCDNVAVVRARLAVDAAAEMLASPEALDALVRWLRREHGACAIAAADGEAARLTVGSPVAGVAVRLSRRDGLTVTGRDPAAVAGVAPRVEAFARDLAAAAVQERLVRAIRRRYAVESDQADARGYRALTVSLPT
jgi:hypothetical protein